MLLFVKERKENDFFSWQIFISDVELNRSLKWRKNFRRKTWSNVWEPGENPGRLRHCNGYKFQCHWSKDREGGMRFEAEVRIPV